MDQDFTMPEDRSYDQAEANRLSNYSDTSKQSSDTNTSQVKVSSGNAASEETDLQQTNAAIINKIAPPPAFTVQDLGGGLVQYNYTVR
jgi:hypothetical protein